MADAGAERPGKGGVHIVGAGLAGLSAALVAAEAGRPVAIWEAAGHAGGRCRSFHDTRLDRMIDNGSHLILTGNDAVARYL
ncbi:MAG: NAD(P)-binding protein, partial [Pseudomonadota bacterium]